MTKRKQIEAKDLKKLRKRFHKKQSRICPILKQKIKLADTCIDHSHSSNAKNLKTKEAGLIRGVIHRQVNTWEGKITNSFIRCGLHKMDISLPEALRNLAEYVENPPLIKKKLIHPSEKPKAKELKKNNIKKLVKLFKKKYPNRKIPDVTIYKKIKSGKKKGKERPKKLTAGIEKLYKEFKLPPEFKK